MRHLIVTEQAVKPAIPQPNTLVVVNGELFYYDINGIEHQVGGGDIDLSAYVTNTTLTASLAGKADVAHTHTYASITGKPSTFAPTIGTTATTAKAGNYVPTWAEVTNKPTTFAPVIGTTSTTAKAGNYTPSATEIVTAINAMTPEQITAVQTKLGITTT